MTLERTELDEGLPLIRNAPIRPRAWRELLEQDDVAAIQGPAGSLVLALQDGQLNLHYAFADLEQMRLGFVGLFDQLKPEIDSFGAEYVRIDLVQLPNRNWVEPLLSEVDFVEFGEWLDMVYADLDPSRPPPEFPPGVTMRRGTAEDFDRIVDIEGAAYGDLADGETATRERLEDAAWAGVMEQDGRVVAYAINGHVERAEGRVLSAAVDPDAWGQGLGALVLAAAVFQLTASEARRATVRVRPDVPQALRITQALGFRPGPRGVEWRRPVDEQEIADRRQQRRVGGVKARFGKWR